MASTIGTSVIALMADRDSPGIDRYATSLLLGIAYAASIGGTATLIGTPPNALLAGYLSSDQNIQIGFAQWMIVGIPVSITMMAAAEGSPPNRGMSRVATSVRRTRVTTFARPSSACG